MQDMLRQSEVLVQMQRVLLPRVLPEMPGWDVAVHYQVGHWPAGNYYDFLPLADGRLLFLTADASDQGAPATALVAMMRVVLHACPLSSGEERLPFCPLRETIQQPPHILLGHLNRVLHENSLPEQHMTAFCGVVEPVDGNLHFASAGHPPPRWWQARRRSVESLPGMAGLPLALDHRAVYHHQRAAVEPGDLLAIYSEGLTGAQNADGEVFGRDRLDDILVTQARHGARAVKDAVLTRLDDFLAGADPADDVTLVILGRRP
jgi:sigma-B regulation protein RsbU (phosphoserine phosphatase)